MCELTLGWMMLWQLESGGPSVSPLHQPPAHQCVLQGGGDCVRLVSVVSQTSARGTVPHRRTGEASWLLVGYGVGK